MSHTARLVVGFTAFALGLLLPAFGPSARDTSTRATIAARGAADGAVEVRVTGVVAGAKEHGPSAVLLAPRESSAGLVIPVVVSHDDAAAVTARLKHQSANASEPANQLEEAIRTFGAELQRVEVDGVSPLAATGKLVMRHEGRTLELRARGIDSIALALDSGVPLFVPRALLGEARAVEDFATAGPGSSGSEGAAVGARADGVHL